MKQVFQSTVMAAILSVNVTSGGTLDVGDRFPGIVLPSVEDGTAMSIEQFRGQKLMLHIFASW